MSELGVERFGLELKKKGNMKSQVLWKITGIITPLPGGKGLRTRKLSKQSPDPNLR